MPGLIPTDWLVRALARDDKRRKKRGRKLMLFFASLPYLGALLLLSIALWLFHIGWFGEQWRAGQIFLRQQAHAAGFVLNDIQLVGRKQTDIAASIRAIRAKKGDPLLDIDLELVRQRLLELPWVKDAVVRRRLPQTLYVQIFEREPLARWQHEGVVRVLGDDTKVLQGISANDFSHLILLVGKDAPQHAKALLAQINARPTLAKEILAATRVGERRWDLRVKSGLTIKLPELEASAALDRLTSLYERENLADKAVSVVDMRVPEKLIFTPLPNAEKPNADAEKPSSKKPANTKTNSKKPAAPTRGVSTPQSNTPQSSTPQSNTP